MPFISFIWCRRPLSRPRPGRRRRSSSRHACPDLVEVEGDGDAAAAQEEVPVDVRAENGEGRGGGGGTEVRRGDGGWDTQVVVLLLPYCYIA